MMYLGDFLTGSTVYFAFTTNAADGGRESFSATLEEDDIVIFKDGAAITLTASTITITSEPAARVGVHIIAVDMSNDADFTAGSDYVAVLYASDETLDAQAPAGVLAHWSCENRPVIGVIYGTAATGTLSATVMTSDLTGYANDQLIGRTIVWYKGTAVGQASTITDYASTNGTVTYNAITTVPVNGDSFVIV